MYHKVAVLLILAVVLVALSAIPVVSQQAAETGVKNALNIKDAEALRQQIQALTELLKTAAPPENRGQQAGQTNSLTMADVFNKGLDMIGGSVATIAGYLEKTAPQVWRIMIRQQYANALYGLVTPFLFLLIGVVYFYGIGKIMTKPEEVDWDNGPGVPWAIFARILPIVYLAVVAIVFATSVGDSVRILVNPEYYAIKDMVGMVMGAVGK